jgi:hypothetical protein
MTITLAWWMLPILILIVGAVIAKWVANSGGGDYDFVTPLLLLIVFGTTIAAAVGILIGKLFL